MSNIVLPHTWVPLEIPTAANFNAVQNEIRDKFNTYAVQTDVAKTITVSHTFNADILFGDGLYDIGKSGATRPRDGFFSRNIVVGNILLFGSAISTGAAAGEGVLANLKGLRGANAAASGTKNLVRLNGDDRVEIAEDGTSVYMPFATGGALLVGTTDTTNVGTADVRSNGALWIKDGIAAPTARAGFMVFYIDSADGDLKVKFGDGITKTLTTDT